MPTRLRPSAASDQAIYINLTAGKYSRMDVRRRSSVGQADDRRRDDNIVVKAMAGEATIRIRAEHRPLIVTRTALGRAHTSARAGSRKLLLLYKRQVKPTQCREVSPGHTYKPNVAEYVLYLTMILTVT